MESLTNEELYYCLSFLDAKSLCRISCCSSRLKRLVLDNPSTEDKRNSKNVSDQLWEPLCWWKIRPVTHDFCRQYKARALFDLEMYRYITENSPLLDVDNPSYRPRLLLLTDIVAQGEDVSLCLDYMKRRLVRGEPRALDDLTLLFESVLLQEFQKSMGGGISHRLLLPFPLRVQAVEMSAVNISKLLFTTPDLEDDDFYTMEVDIAWQLDELADSVRSRIPPGSSDQAIAQALTDRLRECGFRGNKEDYYNPNNSSIRHVLQNKTGNPNSLAILCQLILSRLDVESHVLAGFPSHVLLGLSDGQTFLDVFALEQQDPPFLGIQQCKELARGFSHIWADDFIVPSAPNMVLERVLNNLGNTREVSVLLRQRLRIPRDVMENIYGIKVYRRNT
jgi:regulator of sirC expression with transglutaminase-like and TPR domain